MPTRTTPRPRRAAAPPGRFARSTPPAGRFGRTTTPSSRFAVRRKPAPRSKGNKALNGLAGMLPGSVLGRAAKPSAGGSRTGRAGGLALLAGAAGLVMRRRRDKQAAAEPLPPS